MNNENKLIGEYNEVLEESLSKDHVFILENLIEPTEDLALSEKLKMDKQELRKILNDLLENRLVSYVKDQCEDSGSRKTIWQIRGDQIPQHSINYLENQIETLHKNIQFSESNMAYQCSCKLVDYKKAVEDGFSCKNCGKPYDQYHNPNIDNLVLELTRLTGILQKHT